MLSRRLLMGSYILLLPQGTAHSPILPSSILSASGWKDLNYTKVTKLYKSFSTHQPFDLTAWSNSTLVECQGHYQIYFVTVSWVTFHMRGLPMQDKWSAGACHAVEYTLADTLVNKCLFCLMEHAIIWMFVFSSDLYAEILTPNMGVLGGGLFRRWLGYEGRDLINRISALIKEVPERSLPFRCVRTQISTIYKDTQSGSILS